MHKKITYICKEKEQQPESEVEKMKTIIGCRKVYHVYGEYGHRQRESFRESYELLHDERKTMICVRNSDITGTNDYTEIDIIAKNEKECDEILDAQLTDGIFENCRTGKVVAIRVCQCKIEIFENGVIRMDH